MSGRDDAALNAALRPAVAANVLLADGDGYLFRHELIREAVLEDVLAGERAQAHRGFAEALAAAPSLSPGGTAAVELALHWRGAHEHERALAAAWQAAAAPGSGRRGAIARCAAGAGCGHRAARSRAGRPCGNVRAEAARANGDHNLAGWDATTAAWEGVGHPYPLAYAFCAPQVPPWHLGTGHPPPPGYSAPAILAGELRARPLAEQISQLARRARIDLPIADRGTPTTPFGLTGRELEVLRLVAAGCSNRQIAAQLFISPKTASVHVSNILGKLQVASRGEAAAAAHRLHLFR